MEKVPFETWEYKDQTKMKHYVFADYFDKWIKIVGKYNKLNYIDGFAGIGAYKDIEGRTYYGSPILAAKAIERNKSNLQRSVNLLVIDKDKKNLKNIERIFKHEKLSIKPTLIADNFDQTINDILDKVKDVAPTFIFIDPFGFNIGMETLRKIMAINKSELLLNFMFTRINQFLSADSIEHVYNGLFGGNEWQAFKEYRGAERERDLIEYYRDKLKEFSKFVYYYKFEFPSKRKTYYYLFHLTNYYLGCSIMKSSFAKFNFGRVEYRGLRSGQLELFEQSSIKLSEAAEMLEMKYRTRELKYRDIIEDNIDSCEYLVV
jgi:three-Cys-motif partner protein